jgi:hypothetical protein
MIKATLLACFLALAVALSGCNSSDGLVIQGRTFNGTSPYYGAIGIDASGSQGGVIRDVRLENLAYGLKIGSGPQTRGLSVDGVVATNNSQALFLANVSDSNLRNLDLQCYSVADAPSGSKNHVIYLERGNHNLLFTNVTLSGGSGQTLQMFCYENRDEPSDDITFDGLTIRDSVHGPIVISGGYSRVTIKNLRATASGADFPVIQLYGDADNIVIDGFECWGGQALLGTADGPLPHARNIVLKNGIYHGGTLVYGAGKIDGLVIDSSVRLEP